MFINSSAIFTEMDAEATKILYHIALIAQSFGLKINEDKAKVMTMMDHRPMLTSM